MDVDKILSGAIRFSNFMTVRLVFCGFLVWTLVPSASFAIDSESLLNSLPLIENAVKSYEKTIEALGIADAAIYLLLFVLITVIHLAYSISVLIGKHIPVALVFPSLRNLERNIVVEVSNWMQNKIASKDTKIAILEKIRGYGEEVQESYKVSCQAAQEAFRLFKFLVVYILLVHWFGPADTAATDYFGFFLLSCLVICLLSAFRLRTVNFNCYSQFIRRVDDVVIPDVAPHVESTELNELAAVLEAHEARFKTTPDVNLPILGSARVLLRQYRDVFRSRRKRNQV